MAKVRTVVLYLRHRVRPETLEAIAKATDGELIGVEDSEMTAFLPLNILLPDELAKKAGSKKP